VIPVLTGLDEQYVDSSSLRGESAQASKSKKSKQSASIATTISFERKTTFYARTHL
jgi:hypothetical protein